MERRCTKCDEWLEENNSNFYMVNKKYPDKGFMSECKKCMTQRSAKIQNENPIRSKKYKDDWISKNKKELVISWHLYNKTRKLKQKEYMSAYQKNNSDKLKKYNQNHRKHDITKTEWKACKDYFNNQCAYCGLPIKEHYITFKGKVRLSDFHREHIDDNGANDLSNCVPSCKECNSTKGNKDILELFSLNFIKDFTQDKYNKIIKWITEDYMQYIEEKLPYKIVRKQNKDSKTFHYELWTVDEKRNIIECIGIADKKEGLNTYIDQLEV